MEGIRNRGSSCSAGSFRCSSRHRRESRSHTALLPCSLGWENCSRVRWASCGGNRRHPLSVFLKAGAFVSVAAWRLCRFCTAGSWSRFHWLTERQFLSGCGSDDNAGPVVITAGFIVLGSGTDWIVACRTRRVCSPYLIVIAGAPYYRRFAKNLQVKAFVQGVTAAAVGAIAGRPSSLERRSLIDVPTI
jgi:hypothetical protein